ncbi:MAG TPA: hypothetical protein VGE09_08455 [Pseudoxanthomonas sp.]
MKQDELRRMALEFIDKHGSDCVGVIDSEEKVAAALFYVRLHRDGLLSATPTADGPEYRLTAAGQAALRVQ